MDERFLEEMRRDPRPEFASGLRSKLHAQGSPQSGWRRGPVRVLAMAAGVVIVAALFTLPSVRASATAMLDLFRVRKFAVVQFDESRMEKLRQLKDDRTFLVFDQKDVMRDPGPPRYMASLEAAETEAGLHAMRVTYLPPNVAADSIYVQGGAEARFSVSESKLREVLDLLDLHDVTVPPGLEGQWVHVRKPPVLIQTYKSQRNEAGLLQAVSPEVELPTGLDLPRLAEVGLRILGLDAGEARRIAQATDWRSTLLVPVPVNASTFRQVTIHGQQGMLITAEGRNGQRSRSVVMWTENGRVLALMTTLESGMAVQMAESVQ